MSIIVDSFVGSDIEERLYQIGRELEVVTLGVPLLKCGTQGSPFFINSGRFSTGEAQGLLGELIASFLVRAGIEFDMIYGIPYKSISLASIAAFKYFEKTGKQVFYGYCRKEVKDHGEGSDLVGSFDKLKESSKIVVIDDIFTTGSSIVSTLERFGKLNLKVEHIVVLFNRYKIEEKNKNQGVIDYFKKYEAMFLEKGVKIHAILDAERLVNLFKS